MVDTPYSDQAVLGEPASLRQKLAELLTCRICLQVSLIVCVSLLLVEAAILVPSFLRLQNTLHDRVDVDALRSVQVAFRGHDHHGLDEMLADASSEFAKSNITGASIYSVSGSLLASMGDAPSMLERAADSGAGPRRRDVVLGHRNTGLPFDIVARVDTSHVAEELRAFVLRVGGLVAIIVVVVSAVTIGTIRMLVLEPLLRIRRYLHGAENDPTNPDRYRIGTRRKDEIGDTIGTLNSLLERLSSNSRSEILERERRIKDYADASSDWFWEMDENLRFSHFSDRFSDVTGVHQDALLGKTREETGIPGVSQSEWEEHLENLHNHRPFRNFVHPRTLPDGKTVWLSINGKPIFDDQGSFKGYRGAGTDITHLKQIEEQLADKTAKIESQAASLEQALKTQIEYNSLQKEFVSMASHEFRTPLTIIDAAAQRVVRKAEQLSPDEIRERVGTIRDAVKRLTRLIESTLDAAKAEAGTIEFHPQKLNVEDLVDGVCRHMQDIATSHRIEADLQGVPRSIRGDPGLLEQVLTNLLSNAVKYSGDGEVIALTARAEGGDLLLSVRDCGIGIPAPELPKLFQKYFRASTATGIAGTGLGLHLARKMVVMHGGSIEVESVEGEGSTFTVRLPMEGPDTPADA